MWCDVCDAISFQTIYIYIRYSFCTSYWSKNYVTNLKYLDILKNWVVVRCLFHSSIIYLSYFFFFKKIIICPSSLYFGNFLYLIQGKIIVKSQLSLLWFQLSWSSFKISISWKSKSNSNFTMLTKFKIRYNSI